MLCGRILLCVALVCVLGCSARLGHLELVSSKNVALGVEPTYFGAIGRHCVYQLFGLIPLGKAVPDVEEAMGRALERVPDTNVIQNIVVERQTIHLLLVARECLQVKGDLGELR